jgi:hypothetical protein
LVGFGIGLQVAAVFVEQEWLTFGHRAWVSAIGAVALLAGCCVGGLSQRNTQTGSE